MYFFISLISFRLPLFEERRIIQLKFASDERNSKNQAKLEYLVFCSSDANFNGTIEVSGIDLVGVGAISIFFKKLFFLQISH